MENQDSFNRRIIAELKMQGRKKKWIADILGVTPSTISNKISGRIAWTYAEVFVIKHNLLIEGDSADAHYSAQD